MKIYCYFFVLCCLACSKQTADEAADKAAVIKLVEDETKFAAAADFASWTRCWARLANAQLIITSDAGVSEYSGWTAIRNRMNKAKPFALKVQRDNYRFFLSGDVAFVSYNQFDNWDGKEGRETRETRTVKRIEGHWKIVNAMTVVLSSYSREERIFKLAGRVCMNKVL